MALSDQTLYCRDCNSEFTFTVGEQEFYASRGLTNAPSRCPDCRAARKAAGGGAGGGMGRSGGGGGGGGFRPAREMHEVVCAGCGGIAKVPFLPRGDRPVYCPGCLRGGAR